MKVRIKPSSAFGTTLAPPSKSYAHRLLICAALSNGKSKITGISDSEDMKATLDCISALGASYEKNGNTVTINGKIDISDNAVFNCRESGSTLRFILPIAITSGKQVSFSGTPRLIERGISVYEEIFADKGICITKSENLITVTGKLKSGRYTLKGDVSSQFVSGLLFSLALLDGDSVVQLIPPVESRRYIDITIDAMSRFGIDIEKGDNCFFIKGGQTYKSTDIKVEGDWSNAAALYALNCVGSSITVDGLNPDSLQGDRVCVDYLKRLCTSSPTLDLSNCPDLAPVLFAVAAMKSGAVFTGTRRLKIKESDRAQAMADELEKFGVICQINENSVVIPKTALKPPSEVLSGHNDHRIVMAMTVLASVMGSVIDDAQAISKSYPDFFDVLKSLHLEVEYVT